MRVSTVRLLVAVCVLALAIDAAPPAPVVAQGRQVPGVPDGAWVQLGPGDGFYVQQLAVSSGWPADPFTLATGSDAQSRRTTERGSERVFPDLIRSSDGGATWDRFALSSGGVSTLTVAPASQAGRVVLGVSSEPVGTDRSQWFTMRSADGGVTWARGLNLTGTSALVRFSPAFADDGQVFLLDNGALYRSRDFGETWVEVSLVAGQRVQSAEFSPAFATDRTIVAAVVSGIFSVPWEHYEEQRLPHHANSVGVMISTDGGETWHASSTSLAIDGIPYRYVQQVSVSPSFEQDGLLFAFAWGPWEPDARPAALFRSSDRGQIWTPVWRSPDGKDGVRWYATFALSPGFGADAVGQVALLGLNSWSISPHSTAPCQVYGTADSGQSWNLVPRQNHRAPGCTGLKVVAGGPTGRIWYTLRFPGEGRRQEAFRSTDDGRTWEFIIPPARIFPGGGYWPYTITPDGAFIVGTSDGIWLLPPPPAAGIQP